MYLSYIFFYINFFNVYLTYFSKCNFLFKFNLNSLQVFKMIISSIIKLLTINLICDIIILVSI